MAPLWGLQTALTGSVPVSTALAEVLSGDVSPAGRLPLTFVQSLDQVPDFSDYSMQGRTYRFMTEEPLYRFGYGLSYTTFVYSDLTVAPDTIRDGGRTRVQVTVTNTGDRASDEVVQLYVSDQEASVPVPRLHLEGMQRIHLQPGAQRVVAFDLTSDQLASFDDDGQPFLEPGEFRISVGGGQPDDSTSGAVSAILTVPT